MLGAFPAAPWKRSAKSVLYFSVLAGAAHMAESVWRRRAPLWLRIVAGILILPLLGIILFVATRAFGLDAPLFWLFVIAAALAWLIAYRAPTPIAAAFLVLPLLGYVAVFYLGSEVQDTFGDVGSYLDRAPSPESQAEASPPDVTPPTDAAPAPDEAPRGDAGGGHHFEIPSDDEQAAPSAAEAPGPAERRRRFCRSADNAGVSLAAS